MIDPHGGEWLMIDEVLERLPHLRRDLLWQWASRGVVGTYRIDRRLWFFMPDVLDREAAARAAGFRRGRRQASKAP